MPPEAYRELLAATNMKQRVRKLLEYTWADRLGYAVIGTPNLLEYDQGFFVKGGDGLADVKPIARLYKSQVYVLARELGLPEAIADARADHRDVQPAPDPGGVLLRPPVRAHGPADLGPRPRDSSRPRSRRGSGSSPRRSRPPTGRSSAAGWRPTTCTPRRSSSTRATEHVRDRRHRAPGRRAQPVDEQALLRMAGAIRAPRPGRVRARARRRRRPGRHPARDLRHPARLAAARVRSRRQRAGLQRRGLQPP